MKSLHCSNEIPDSIRYCNECGVPLSSTSLSDAIRDGFLKNYLTPELAKIILSAMAVATSPTLIMEKDYDRFEPIPH